MKKLKMHKAVRGMFYYDWVPLCGMRGFPSEMRIAKMWANVTCKRCLKMRKK